MMDIDDQTLLRMFVKSGSEAAFTELVNRHSALVTRIVQSRIHNQDASQDVVQLIFCLLVRKAGTLAQHPAIIGWLVKTSVFESKKHLRREVQRMKRDSAHGALQEEQPEETPFLEQDYHLIDQAIADLPEKIREPLLMRYYQGESFSAIGKRIGKSEGTAQKLVSRAVKKLRSVVGGHSSKFGSTGAFTALITLALKPTAQASTDMSFIATNALQTSSTISATTIISNSIYTMTTTQLKFAAIVAIAASVPIAMQWTSNNTLKKQVAELESANHSEIQTQKGDSRQRSSSAATTSQGGVRASQSDDVSSDLESFLKKFDAASISGGRRSPQWRDAMQSLDGLDAEQLKGLIKAIEKTDYGSLAKRDASHAIVEQLARVDPEQAAEYLLQTVGPGALGRTMKEWAQRDPDSAYAWLLNKQRTGKLVSKGTTPEGHDNPFSQLMSGMAIAAPEKALSAWTDVPHELDSNSLRGVIGSLRTEEHRQSFLEQVSGMSDEKKAATASLAYAIGLGELVPLERVAPEINQLGLSAESRNRALVEIARGSLVHGGEAAATSAEWLVENSDSTNVQDNVRNLTKEWTESDLEGAAEWLGTINNEGIRDAAVSGFVDRISGMEPSAAFEWAGDISDPTLRQNLQKSVLETWQSSDSAAAAKAALENGIEVPQPESE